MTNQQSQIAFANNVDVVQAVDLATAETLQDNDDAYLVVQPAMQMPLYEFVFASPDHCSPEAGRKYWSKATAMVDSGCKVQH